MRVENETIISMHMAHSGSQPHSHTVALWRAEKCFLIAIKCDCDQSKSFICMAINGMCRYNSLNNNSFFVFILD